MIDMFCNIHRPPVQIATATAAGWLAGLAGAVAAPYFDTGKPNSAPLAMLWGQRCITLFCLV